MTKLLSKSLFNQPPFDQPKPERGWQSGWICLFTIAASAITALPATAVTRSAEFGTVRAEYSDQPGQACVENPRLTITREGQTAFDAALTGEGLCRQDEDVFAVEDLDGDGEPEVILDFSSGGAHCCSSSLIFRYNPNQEQYTSIQHLWGEGQGARRREDLDGDDVLELIHYDSRFAYAFSSFAESGLPIRIWQYREGEMVNVTRSYPKQIYDDAYKWWQRYTEANRQGSDVKGILAAYLADKYLLGEAEDGWQRLEQVYQGNDRQQFFTKLREFLAETDYTTATAAPRRTPLVRRPTDPPAQMPTRIDARDAEPPSILLEQRNTLAPGDATLQVDGTLYDQYTFSGQAGQQVVITLESTDFDPYVILVDSNQTIIAENDDADAGSQNSQLTVTLPQNGIYTVVANAYQEEGQGEYRLTVTSDAIPVEAESDIQQSAEATANSSEYGTIEGTLSYPSEERPALTICAQSTQNYYLLNCVEAEANQQTFRITIKPGEYYIFSYQTEVREGTTNTTNNVRNDSIQNVTYYARSETSNDPLPVRVMAGKTISGISPKNARVCSTRTPEPAYCIKPPN